MPVDLVPLPEQPTGVPWPTAAWPTGDDLPHEAATAVDEMFGDHERFERTFAVLVVHRGRLLLERYADQLDHWDAPSTDITADTPLLSWSMAKSILHAAVGIAVGEGLLDPLAPAAVPEWRDPQDPRGEITLDHLLEMRDGLEYQEDYLDGHSHVLEMLFGEGKDDVAAYAAARPPAHPPGTTFNYSSGTSNIVARILGDAVGGEAGVRSWLEDRLFAPIGIRGAEPRFDPAGTFLGSSYVYAPARDYARFGYLYLRDGVWDGVRILPEGWVDHGRRQRSWDPVEEVGYGAHWWTTGDELGTWRASGYEGQTIMLCPARDLLVVRLGKTDAVHGADLRAWRQRMVDAF